MNLMKLLRGGRALVLCVRQIPVSEENAKSRCLVCANCPWLERSAGPWVLFVTLAYERLRKPGALSGFEPWLGRWAWACRLCRCPLRSKTRLPLPFILRHTPTDLYDRLPKMCWIKSERAQLDDPAKTEQG
jgi:hypothetical protein